MAGQILGCELNSLAITVPSLPIFFYFFCHLGHGGSGVLNEVRGRRHSSTADEEEDHICINTFVGALCLELAGWGAWQVRNRPHGPAASRSKDRQENGAGPSNVKDLLLLGDAGFESLWCYSLLTQAGLCAGQGKVFQGTEVQLEFWRCRRKACEVGMTQVEKREAQDAVLV